MVDWTTVLVALVSGAAGLSGGLYAAKRQADALLSQVIAENDRFMAQQAEEQRRSRETVYLEFVVAARKYQACYTQTATAPMKLESASDDEVLRYFAHLRDDWHAEFSEKQSAVRLFGTDQVRDAVDELSMAIDELNGRFGAAHDQLSGGAAAERIWNAFDSLSKDRWHAAARKVVDEMRADIVRWRAAAVAAARPRGNE